MHKLLFVLSVVLLSGCWGPEFQARSDFDDPVESTATGTSTTGEATGSGGSTAGSSTATTTGAAGATTGELPTTTTSSTGTPTGSSACEPPGAIPELAATRPWKSFEAETSRLCGQVVTGTLRCAGEPCAEFTLPARVEPWSEDGLTLRVVYEPADPQPFQAVHDCGLEAYTCDYVLVRDTEVVYFLELRETESGYAVKAFYELGDEPADTVIHMMPRADFAARPVPEECYTGDANPNVFSTDFWVEYVEWVRTLEWNCDGELR